HRGGLRAPRKRPLARGAPASPLRRRARAKRQVSSIASIKNRRGCATRPRSLWLGAVCRQKGGQDLVTRQPASKHGANACVEDVGQRRWIPARASEVREQTSYEPDAAGCAQLEKELNAWADAGHGGVLRPARRVRGPSRMPTSTSFSGLGVGAEARAGSCETGVSPRGRRRRERRNR